MDKGQAELGQLAQLGEHHVVIVEVIGSSPILPIVVDVAQAGRALGCGSKGCGFESHRSPFINPKSLRHNDLGRPGPPPAT